MIGAGAKILGNIEVGENTRVAAGSGVLREVQVHATPQNHKSQATHSIDNRAGWL